LFINFGTPKEPAAGVLLHQEDLRVIANNPAAAQQLTRESKLNVVVADSTLRNRDSRLVGPST
jgi:DeoR/GlpR family transcriptional regulator of sugar metabolism